MIILIKITKFWFKSYFSEYKHI